MCCVNCDRHAAMHEYEVARGRLACTIQSLELLLQLLYMHATADVGTSCTHMHVLSHFFQNHFYYSPDLSASSTLICQSVKWHLCRTTVSTNHGHHRMHDDFVAYVHMTIAVSSIDAIIIVNIVIRNSGKKLIIL